jgi:hypothetical protein
VLARNHAREMFTALGRFLADGELSMATEIEPRERSAIFGGINAQLQSYGDGEHVVADWLRSITFQMNEAPGDERRRLVNIAASAVAAIESLDKGNR